MRQFVKSAGIELYLCGLMLALVWVLTADEGRTHPQAVVPPHISQVDVIERNTVHDGAGKVTLAQYILWDWERRDKMEHVVAWRMVKAGDTVTSKNGFYNLPWGKRIVQAVSYRDRHSQTDLEVDDREYRAAELRRGAKWGERP